ncbi:hypothetical protein [Algoriphagus sp. Y33]|uniref:hypothetical protein n=1 Tax=Algoriphagus sp. Y33 TaxID=2772483 RepID=UPI00177C7C63|nr:hypothetical protein [Algoriphagus sp. Y33]
MPANKKYLTQSPWIKLGKLSAAVVGGLLASVGFHMALAIWIDRALVLTAAVYSVFIIWVGLMLVSYWVPRVWQAWGLMVLIVLISALAIYLGR